MKERIAEIIDNCVLAYAQDTTGAAIGGVDRAADQILELLFAPTPDGGEARERVGIYVASRTKYAGMWRALRAEGWPVTATWIDEVHTGDSDEWWVALWSCCDREAAACGCLVLYAEEGDTLRGALRELGAALSHGRPVVYVGPDEAIGNMRRDPRIRRAGSIPAALEMAVTLSGTPQVEREEEALVAEILAELRRARSKFPGDNVTTLALVEEVGELAKATFEESRDRVRKEAVQVATMAMRVVLDGDQTLDAWRDSRGLDPLLAARLRGEEAASNPVEK